MMRRRFKGIGHGMRGFGNGIAEFGRNIITDATSSGFDAAGYPIDDDDFDLPEAPSDARGRSTRDARGRSTRERFNSRYGSGGRRAMMRRRFKTKPNGRRGQCSWWRT
jgi:hypothetical protein